MRGIRHHPLTQPVVVLVALLLACSLGFVALRIVPHQARLERWLQKQPGVTSAWVSAGADREASDWSSDASVGLDGELTPASFSRFASAYEAYRADHPWAGDWGLTISYETVTLPVSRDHASNVTTRDLLALLATDPDVSSVWFEHRYLNAVVIESADPASTKAHLAPVLAQQDRVRVIRPGETLHP
jgi:hypothetical protein